MSDRPQAFVRGYNPDNDLQSTIHVFRETCDDSLKVEPIWTIGSYIWCRPYLMLSPSTCFVVDDGNGKAVGYIIGVPDSEEFCKRWRDVYAPKISSELDSLPSISSASEEETKKLAKRRDDLLSLIRNYPEKLVLGQYQEHLKPYPGHLHIDILPSHQRQGLGRYLIQHFLSAVKDQGCTGAYLGMVASNENAAKFYNACGFKRLEHVLDDGASGELGRTGKNEDGGESIYYVVDL
jgi:GNAT superfamily N-acetyltransferase